MYNEQPTAELPPLVIDADPAVTKSEPPPLPQANTSRKVIALNWLIFTIGMIVVMFGGNWLLG
ncbi:hypothetical protein [Paracoccus sp. (in: a-proteobacteria)]|uniref:hypothetical protein n=1 Tax=Paracoccus sp. TaxID=267 RepID=UPI00289BDF0D|nr:hypothetical protein [Paracoccus sp. (in: a-proteobacteria)]